MSVIEEKKALRTYIRQTERTLDPAYKAESSEAICRCVLALEEYRAAGTVFAFAGTVHEIDTSLLLTETLAAGKTLVLPRCAEGHALDLCVVTSMDELVPGMYGILEPKADCALVTPADIDFAVVPCLCCDRDGRRLGHGGGYYDRYLSTFQGVKIGVNYSDCVRPKLIGGRYDVPVDLLVTDRYLRRCTTRPSVRHRKPVRQGTKGDAR